LNNLKATDYVNIIIQSLCRIPPLRDFFLLYNEKGDIKEDLMGRLTQTFAELIRKIWNAKNFKGQVSPHELLQAISLASNKEFKIGVQKDPSLFISWFLNSIHTYLCTKYHTRHSIISDTFQGEVQMNKYLPMSTNVNYRDKAQLKTRLLTHQQYQHSIANSKFWYISLLLSGYVILMDFNGFKWI